MYNYQIYRFDIEYIVLRNTKFQTLIYKYGTGKIICRIKLFLIADICFNFSVYESSEFIGIYS